jgi:hypothetical protein
VLDVGQLLGSSVLCPGDGPIAVVDQRGVRDPVGHQPLLERPIPSAPWPFSAQSGWKCVHQQLANMPLFRSTRAAKSSNVSGVSALIVKSGMPAKYNGSRTFGVRQITLPGRRTRRRGSPGGVISSRQLSRVVCAVARDHLAAFAATRVTTLVAMIRAAGRVFGVTA